MVDGMKRDLSTWTLQHYYKWNELWSISCFEHFDTFYAQPFASTHNTPHSPDNCKCIIRHYHLPRSIHTWLLFVNNNFNLSLSINIKWIEIFFLKWPVKWMGMDLVWWLSSGFSGIFVHLDTRGSGNHDHSITGQCCQCQESNGPHSII